MPPQSTTTTGKRKRARAIEASTFALGTHDLAADTAGHPEVDAAFAQARTWEKAAHNLQLLTIYEQRIRRAVEKNMAQFETLQTKRKLEAAEAMKQAKMLYRLAQAQGKPYRPEAFFTAAPEVKESVFSSTEIARELSRARLLAIAQTYDYNGELPEATRTAPGGRLPLSSNDLKGLAKCRHGFTDNGCIRRLKCCIPVNALL